MWFQICCPDQVESSHIFFLNLKKERKRRKPDSKLVEKIKKIYLFRETAQLSTKL